MKAENPRSRVMPRALLCGCLSKAAVDSSVLKARTSDVFPESTCPNIPTFTFAIIVCTNRRLDTPHRRQNSTASAACRPRNVPNVGSTSRPWSSCAPDRHYPR